MLHTLHQNKFRQITSQPLPHPTPLCYILPNKVYSTPPHPYLSMYVHPCRVLLPQNYILPHYVTYYVTKVNSAQSHPHPTPLCNIPPHQSKFCPTPGHSYTFMRICLFPFTLPLFGSFEQPSIPTPYPPSEIIWNERMVLCQICKYFTLQNKNGCSQ